MPRKVTIEGHVYKVPDDATDEEVLAIHEGKRYEPKVAQANPAAHPENAPAVGRFTANALPAVGSVLAPELGLGTVAGTMAKTFLRNSWPTIFGEPVTSLGGLAGETAKDLIVNKFLPEGVGKVAANVSKASIASAPILRNMPAVREGAARTITNEIMGKFGSKPETQIIEEGAANSGKTFDNLETQLKQAQAQNPTQPPSTLLGPNGQPLPSAPQGPHPAVQKAMKDLEDTFGPNKVGQKLLKLDSEVKAGANVARTQEYKDIANVGLKDVIHVDNWKLAAGPEAVQDLAFNKLLTGGFKTGESVLDAKAILAELNGGRREIYERAISPQNLSAFKDFVNEIHTQQEGHGFADALVRWTKGKLIWTGIGLTTLTHLGTGGTAGLAAGAVQITNKMLAKAMENPQTAQAVVQAMRTPASAAQASTLNQVLQNIFKVGAAGAETASEQ